MISELEQQTLDIDWFFTDNEEIAFVASGGGKLPSSVAKSSEKNMKLVAFFRSLPENGESIINLNIGDYIQNENVESYLADFRVMSRKGLYAFDKTILNNFNESGYHLVTRPSHPIKMNDLPEEIRLILIETLLNDKLSRVSSIDILSIK